MTAFYAGQRVRLRVPTMGGDENDVERSYPAGTAGVVAWMDPRGIVHVEVGPEDTDRVITQCFDVGAEADAALDPL